LELVLTGGCNDLEVISVLMKEIVFCKKLRPIRRSDDYLIHNIRPLDEVLVPPPSREVPRKPFLNSSVITICVEAVTLWVAHIAGYAGVMIGIRCARSLGYN
jgi:hypothetical protein